MEFVQNLFLKELDYVRAKFPDKSEDFILREVSIRVNEQLLTYEEICTWAINRGMF
jgi:hypothetical protein